MRLGCSASCCDIIRGRVSLKRKRTKPLRYSLQDTPPPEGAVVTWGLNYGTQKADWPSNFSIKSRARAVIWLKITQHAATTQPCPRITSSYFSFSSSFHISPLAPTSHFTGVFAQKCHQLKNTHNHGWDSELLWVSEFIFPLQMYSITTSREKWNRCAITGSVDRNTGYSSITADKKIRRKEMEQGHFNVWSLI